VVSFSFKINPPGSGEVVRIIGSIKGAGPATPAALYSMVTIPEAQQKVLAETLPLPPVIVDLADAGGLILAEDVLAPEPLPPFPASIKVPSIS
jgi:hypothetical protein